MIVTRSWLLEAGVGDECGTCWVRSSPYLARNIPKVIRQDWDRGRRARVLCPRISLSHMGNVPNIEQDSHAGVLSLEIRPTHIVSKINGRGISGY
jgi:hypothetical protein